MQVNEGETLFAVSRATGAEKRPQVRLRAGEPCRVLDQIVRRGEIGDVRDVGVVVTVVLLVVVVGTGGV